jgi:transposase
MPRFINQGVAVKQAVKKHDWIHLEHVEPYSPEYNPIERFWKWLKAKVYGATACGTIFVR